MPKVLLCFVISALVCQAKVVLHTANALVHMAYYTILTFDQEEELVLHFKRLVVIWLGSNCLEGVYKIKLWQLTGLFRSDLLLSSSLRVIPPCCGLQLQ